MAIDVTAYAETSASWEELERRFVPALEAVGEEDPALAELRDRLRFHLALAYQIEGERSDSDPTLLTEAATLYEAILETGRQSGSTLVNLARVLASRRASTACSARFSMLADASAAFSPSWRISASVAALARARSRPVACSARAAISAGGMGASWPSAGTARATG